mgnify:CR=1 FL=1
MGIISIKDLFCLNLAVIDSMSYANQHNHVLSESEIQQKENVSYEHVENIHVVCTIIYLRRILTNVKSEKKYIKLSQWIIFVFQLPIFLVCLQDQ